MYLFLQLLAKFRYCSAWAPIANPLTCPWGKKAFGNYLGSNEELWHKYDPTHLIGTYQHEHQPDILIHQGAADGFYYKDHQLQPEKFVEAAEASNYKGKVDLNVVDGYDHSYFFICLFAEAHAKHHAKHLGLSSSL